MDCFKSGRDAAALVEAEVVLDGLAGGAACAPPKKSSPNSESAGFVALGGAGSALGVGLLRGGPVLGRAGAETSSSPNKSTTGAWRVMAEGCDGPAGGAGCLCDADLSIFAFSWTTFKG
jgi:hypothetical protein